MRDYLGFETLFDCFLYVDEVLHDVSTERARASALIETNGSSEARKEAKTLRMMATRDERFIMGEIERLKLGYDYSIYRRQREKTDARIADLESRVVVQATMLQVIGRGLSTVMGVLGLDHEATCAEVGTA